MSTDAEKEIESHGELVSAPEWQKVPGRLSMQNVAAWGPNWELIAADDAEYMLPLDVGGM